MDMKQIQARFAQELESFQKVSLLEATAACQLTELLCVQHFSTDLEEATRQYPQVIVVIFLVALLLGALLAYCCCGGRAAKKIEKAKKQ